MNKQSITPEVHAAFVAAGCVTMGIPGKPAYYSHRKSELHFYYAHDLPAADEIFNVDSVIVPTVTGYTGDYPYDVVALDDLEYFIGFRAFSPACAEHRILKLRSEVAWEEYKKADLALAAAEQALDAACDAYTKCKPPRCTPSSMLSAH